MNRHSCYSVKPEVTYVVIAMLTVVGAFIVATMVLTFPAWASGVWAGRRPGPTPLAPPTETRLRRWAFFIGSAFLMAGSFYGIAVWGPLTLVGVVPGFLGANLAAYRIGAAWWNSAHPRPTSYPQPRLTTHPDPDSALTPE